MAATLPKSSPNGLSRRGVLAAAGVSASFSLTQAPPAGAQSAVPAPKSTVPVKLRVNGRDHDLSLDPRTSLLDALREHLGLTGSKKGCDHGQCGACTVLIDGHRVLGCLTLAVAVRGEVTTIEGIAPAGAALHPMQQAFIDHDAFQCGYCTPGQILSAIACSTSRRQNASSRRSPGMAAPMRPSASISCITSCASGSSDGK